MNDLPKGRNTSWEKRMDREDINDKCKEERLETPILTKKKLSDLVQKKSTYKIIKNRYMVSMRLTWEIMIRLCISPWSTYVDTGHPWAWAHKLALAHALGEVYYFPKPYGSKRSSSPNIYVSKQLTILLM